MSVFRLRSATTHTLPPRPPSPPLGPPRGTYFSRRKAALPSPPLPACTCVPRWRPRIWPALTCSPPYTLTPRRLDCESRPLRELPPAFLCAMFRSPCSGSGDDVVDPDLGVVLAVPLRFLEMLAPPQLEDLDLVAAAVAEDGGRDFGARHQ